MADHFDETPLAQRPDDPSVNAALVPGLIVLDAPDESQIGLKQPLLEVLCFGRSAGGKVNLQLNDRLLSRDHATVRRSGNAFSLTDLDSTNGTYLNGMRAHNAVARLGDVIRAGESLLYLSDISLTSAPDERGGMLSQSPKMAAALSKLESLRETALSVLITGETGTGKELAARYLHEASGRAGPFLAVNCGAISSELAEAAFFGHKRGAFTGAKDNAPGYWEQTAGGTLFLDEIGELPLDLQPKLLRVLESREFIPVGATTAIQTDTRIVAATNVDLAKQVEAGKFRQDLFARLRGFTVELPPLRHRREDVLLLFRTFFAAAHPAPRTLSIALKEQLLLYDWPMNVRELRDVARHLAIVHHGVTDLDVQHLPPEWKEEIASKGIGPSKVELRRALVRHRGNVMAIAEELGCNRRQVYRWLDKCGLSADDFREK